MNLETLNPRVGVIDIEKQDTKYDKPKMYNVVLLNDDFTPAFFVVFVLNEVFNLNLQHASQLMITTHRNGKGIVGTYTKDVAESKVAKAENYAKENGHPLKFDIEEAK
jgi:ATP-dependent Clp protease adaptor protein ClpS